MNKKKKWLMIILGIILIIGVIVGIWIWKNVEIETSQITEYTPEEEISEEQMRQTMVSLYFKSGENLVPEARLIDVKSLLNNPYEEILKMLIEGPKNEKLSKTIPEGTKINSIVKEGENLIIDFSKEFLQNVEGEKEEKLIIQSIVNTLTELTEINGIKIVIDGQENQGFPDGKVTFKEIFTRQTQ